MTKILAMPHLTASSVETTEWIVDLNGRLDTAPALLKGWDYSAGLAFESTARLDRRKILAECGLSRDARISVTASWWASSTNRREIGCRQPILDDVDIALRLEIPPGVAGGHLTLERMLILDQPGRSDDDLAAVQQGSILWREPRDSQTRVTLEGDAARLPTEAVDFTSTRVADPESLWWLERDLSDLNSTPLATIRLYLNTSHPIIEKIVSGADDATAETVAKFLEWDVARMLINSALDSAEFLRDWGMFRPGSLGETLELLLQQVWPGEDANSLSGLRADEPGIFEARLQARLRLLAETR